MGLMEMLGVVTGGASGSGLSKAIAGLLEPAGSTGGLDGLLRRLESERLGEVGASWVSDGRNVPVSADQLERVIGEECVRAIAAELRVPHEKAASQLARYLPQVVDRLTPDGSVPGDDELRAGLAMLVSRS